MSRQLLLPHFFVKNLSRPCPFVLPLEVERRPSPSVVEVLPFDPAPFRSVVVLLVVDPLGARDPEPLAELLHGVSPRVIEVAPSESASALSSVTSLSVCADASEVVCAVGIARDGVLDLVHCLGLWTKGRLIMRELSFSDATPGSSQLRLLRPGLTLALK